MAEWRFGRLVVFGREWSTSLIQERGLFERYPYLPPDALVVCFNPEADARYFDAFPTSVVFMDFLDKVPVALRNFNEVLLEGKPQKPHFDIDVHDYETREENTALAVRALTELVSALHTVIPALEVATDVLVFSSPHPVKVSFHVVVDHWCCANEKEGRALYDRCMSYCSKEVQTPIIDHSVYSKNQQFRLFGCSKPDKGNIKGLDEGPLGPHVFDVDDVDEAARFRLIFQASLVSQTQGCHRVPGLVDAETRRGRTTSRAKERGPPVDKDTVDLLFALLEERGVVDQPRKVLVVRETAPGMIAFQRLAPSLCHLCSERRGKQVVHAHENPYVLIDDRRGMVYYCRRARDDQGRPMGRPLGTVPTVGVLLNPTARTPSPEKASPSSPEEKPSAPPPPPSKPSLRIRARAKTITPHSVAADQPVLANLDQRVEKAPLLSS